MNIQSPNHIGVKIGKVIKTGQRIQIKLTDDLSQNDGLRFKESGQGLMVNKLYNSKGLLIKEAHAGDIISIDNKIDLKTNDTVLKTTDYKLLESLKQYPLKKIAVDFKVTAKLNEKLTIEITDYNHKIKVTGNLLEKALTTPTTISNIITQLSKLGNTPFKVHNIDIDMPGNVFIPLKDLNELRRDLVGKLIIKRTEVNRTLPDTEIIPFKRQNKEPFQISAYVTNEQQLKAVLGQVNLIYTDDKALYLKYKKENVYFKKQFYFNY